MYLKTCLGCDENLCDCEENNEILEAGFLAVMDDESTGLKASVNNMINILNGPNAFVRN